MCGAGYSIWGWSVVETGFVCGWDLRDGLLCGLVFSLCAFFAREEGSEAVRHCESVKVSG